MTEMLEQAIEIEGLIRIIRDGNPSEETFALLKRLTYDLCGRVEKLTMPINEGSEESCSEAATPTVSDSIPESAIEQEIADDIRMEEAEAEETSAEKSEKSEEKDTPGEKKEESEENHIYDSPGEDATEIQPETMNDDIFLELDPEEPQNPIPDEIRVSAYEKKNDNRAAEVKSKSQDKKKTEKVATNLKSVFSLNDRFLYSRELFDGDMKMFDSTLRSLEGVDDFTVIEDYFYNELEWDKDNQTVKDFMDRLKMAVEK